MPAIAPIIADSRLVQNRWRTENIRWGAGRGSPKAAVASWMNSPAHRHALLGGHYRHLGVGVALGSPTGGGEGNTAIYTATFGYRG